MAAEPATIDDATELGDTRTSTGVSSRPAARRDGPQRAAGELIGRYVVLGTLGSGGMGVVHAAYDPELDRKVAIKLLHPVRDDKDETLVRARLLREAQAIAKLAHPNVVAVHDVGLHEGRVFVAMEFVDGGTLAQWMRAEPRPWAEVLRLFVEAGRGLAAAHAAGVVHRDFKPANVLLGKDGRPRVADFGIARNTDAQPSESLTALRVELEQTDRTRWQQLLNDASTTATLTETGVFLGTPAYMAPEQFKRARVDARADQFGFCVALYEALYGERPFAGDSVGALYLELREGRVREPPRHREVPAWLRRVVLRGLASDPGERWPDMPSLLAALDQRPRRSGRVFASVAMLAIAVISGATAVALDQPAESGPKLCSEAGDELAPSWSPALREAVRERVASVDERDGAALLAGLDAWARAWQASWTDACEATLLRGVQSQALLDRRMTCLARERRRIGAYVELLREGDDARLRAAMHELDALTEPTRCDDAHALTTGVAAAPDEPGLRAEVERLAAELDGVYASLTAGEWQRAGVALDRLEPAVAQVGWRPLAAELAFLQGWRHHGTEARELAEAGYREAQLAAIAVGDHRLAAAALRDLAKLIAEWESRHDEALEHLRTAEAFAEQLDDDDLRASIELTRASTLEQRGDFEPALAAALRSAEAAARAHGAGSARVAEARYRESMIHYRLGRIDAAKAALAAARAGFGEDRGATHPISLKLINAAGILAGAEGDWAEAARQFEQLADRQAQLFGPDHLDVSDALSNLGGAQSNSGALDAARVSHERALAIRERELGPANLYVGHSLANLAIVYARLERFAEADAAARRALAVIEGVRGPRHHDAMIAHSLIGEVALAARDHAAARAAFATALELAIEVGSPLQQYEFGLQVSLCLVHLGQLDAAAAALERGDRRIAGHEIVPLDQLVHAYLRARIAVETGDLDGAREHIRTARSLLDATAPAAVGSVEEARRWIADQSQL